jgi:hypothetical protein
VSLALYLVEAGIILAIAPWTRWWQDNYFAELWPQVGIAMATPLSRWCVVGVGVVTVVAGLSELRLSFVRRVSKGAPDVTSESPST